MTGFISRDAFEHGSGPWLDTASSRDRSFSGGEAFVDAALFEHGERDRGRTTGAGVRHTTEVMAQWKGPGPKRYTREVTRETETGLGMGNFVALGRQSGLNQALRGSQGHQFNRNPRK